MKKDIVHVPVAYAISNAYECLIISMLSVLETADLNTYYDFYILVGSDFIEENKERIIECLSSYQSLCSINFKKVNNIFENAYLGIEHITKETYFRLLLPELLKEDKCIYLDSDTIVCSDLQELFNQELNDNYIAGVKAPGYVLGADMSKYCEQALLPDIEQYINAGVLVCNLSQMRKDNIVQRFLKLLDFRMLSQDQDIINSVCYGKILFLSFEYNVMSKYATWTIDDYKELFLEEELKKAWNHPKIIHYADRVKPWKNIGCFMGDRWWMVCKRSCLWEFFIKKLEENFLAQIMCYIKERKNTVALFDLSYKTNVVIYGAGNRAREMIKYLREHSIEPEGIIVSDKKENPDKLENIDVQEIKNIKEQYNNKTIIIATLEKYHMEIISKLQYCKFKEIVLLSDSWGRNLSI